MLEDSIKHYDSNNRQWLPLKAGDVQIIRSGSGITHAEKLNPGGPITMEAPVRARRFDLW